MRNTARRHLNSTIRLTNTTPGDDPDPTTGQTVDTIVAQLDWPALIRQQTVAREETEGRTNGVRDLTIWTEATDVEAGWTCEIRSSPDASLIGRSGSVTEVERDDYAVTRRLTLRLTSGV